MRWKVGSRQSSGQPKYYQIVIWFISTMPTTLKSKRNDWFALKEDNVSESNDMSTRGLLCQWPSTIQIHLSMSIYYKADIIIISFKCSLFSPWYIWNIAHLTLNNNYSLTLVQNRQFQPYCHKVASCFFSAKHLVFSRKDKDCSDSD